MATREEELAHKQRTQWETTQALSTDVEDSLTRNKVTVEHMAVAMLEFRADMVCDEDPRLSLIASTNNRSKERYLRAHACHA